MTRQQKIDKMKRAGFTITFSMSGMCYAMKNHKGYCADSINKLHKEIYGY